MVVGGGGLSGREGRRWDEKEEKNKRMRGKGGGHREGWRMRRRIG